MGLADGPPDGGGLLHVADRFDPALLAVLDDAHLPSYGRAPGRACQLPVTFQTLEHRAYSPTRPAPAAWRASITASAWLSGTATSIFRRVMTGP